MDDAAQGGVGTHRLGDLGDAGVVRRRVGLWTRRAAFGRSVREGGVRLGNVQSGGAPALIPAGASGILDKRMDTHAVGA